MDNSRHGKKAYEKIDKSKTKNPLSSKNTALLQIKPDLLSEVLPSICYVREKWRVHSERNFFLKPFEEAKKNTK
ncbi:hypothetical protein MCU_01384 [Bartonella elizabethae Re6043vi]|uniref:Uncharacterized protein n=2 Tax=Bartonella elizabethae TaxID=807 RepID=J0ZXL3_BAREL|nr:hypothetical protein [Bartonella elizabethae]EJF82587.1 hypothetical protein MCU_01384 [Bartonella elizabethae Re6043vi]EJF93823.1 hypothetical protein MEE_01423 [Bartonella elizabethae F9251 = ATCC 49927]VEJ41914.1 Uncharacterised protein [Bartonella elizabethae]